MNPFTQHPRDVGMGYFQHAWGAIKFSVSLMFTGLKIFIHAFLPFLFVRAGDRVIELNEALHGIRSKKKGD